MRKVLILNGPNLNMLGSREPDVYGSWTLDNLRGLVEQWGAELGLDVELRQTNSEAELIEWIQQAFSSKTAVILNPAAFTHYSYALRDACAMLKSAAVPLIEVHISNPHSREHFRQTSVISGVATGVIAGFGMDSYRMAMIAVAGN